jgi:hypothetical protein
MKKQVLALCAVAFIFFDLYDDAGNACGTEVKTCVPISYF